MLLARVAQFTTMCNANMLFGRGPATTSQQLRVVVTLAVTVVHIVGFRHIVGQHTFQYLPHVCHGGTPSSMVAPSFQHEARHLEGNPDNHLHRTHRENTSDKRGTPCRSESGTAGRTDGLRFSIATAMVT